jgi:PAS domain S-box-containing protein
MSDENFRPPPGWRTASQETSELVRSFGWATTPLGPRDGWSPSLALAFDMIQAAAFPMALRWGPDFVLIYNDGYRPILGDKHPWALGLPAREAWAEVWPQIEPAHIAILNGDTPAIFAEDMLLRIQRHGSDWDDARFTMGYSPIMDSTAPTGVGGILVTAVEITERVTAAAALERSEARFRTLAEATPNLLWAADPDGQLNWFNQRAYAYSGPLPDIDRPNWLKIVHPDDAEEAEARWRKSIATGEVYETEFRLRRADGVYRWHIARALPVIDEAGAIVRWIGSNTDIEDQKTTAEALAILNATLEQQVNERTGELMAVEETLRQSQKMEAVGQLTGGIAHDFNNMLAVVIGSLELLSRRLAGGDPRAQRYVNAAGEGARRAALLTQRLLAFSRQQPLQPEPINANRLVSGMSELLRHSIGSDVRLETVLAGGLWPTHADPNQLENVILNLGVNARDAMPDGGRLTIETQNAHLDDRYAASELGVAPGQYVLIAVSDTGSGMPPAVVEKAFDPFFTTKAVGKGTGLGLSQVYGFVRQSGGHVKIYSEEGHGTTVKIYLPRLIGGADLADVTGPGETLILRDSRELVLVVEDEAVVRQFTIDALTELGYRVLEADGAATALRLLDAHPDIALLLTDVVMPDVNGAKLAELARQRRPDLKVLFTTGYTRNAVVHNGVLGPGVELIGKPFSLEALSTKLRLVLGEPGEN